MPTKRTHRKPKVPKEVQEAESVARQMYSSLTQEGAPKATPNGYITGACYVLKMLLEQASKQGTDKEELKKYAISIINES